MISHILWTLLGSSIGLGYYSIYRLTRKTHECTHETQGIAQTTLIAAEDAQTTIKNLNQRLLDLENQIRLNKSDSSRLVEWLDKRDRELVEIQAKFAKHLQLEEREKKLEIQHSKIIELGESLKLITTRK